MNIQIGDGSGSERYRACSQCGSGCEPDPFSLEREGIRIAFVCPNCGVESVIDPFERRP